MYINSVDFSKHDVYIYFFSSLIDVLKVVRVCLVWDLQTRCTQWQFFIWKVAEQYKQQVNKGCKVVHIFIKYSQTIII